MPSIFYLFTVENLNMDTKKFMVISSTFKFLTANSLPLNKRFEIQLKDTAYNTGFTF